MSRERKHMSRERERMSRAGAHNGDLFVGFGADCLLRGRQESLSLELRFDLFCSAM